MKLEKLLKNLDYIELKGNKDIEVLGLSINSKDIKKGYMYAAIKGFRVDGHSFIKDAIEKGASLIVCEDIEGIEYNENIAILKVENTRKAVSYITRNFYDNPTNKLNLIGVTGTNGKTSTTYFLEQIYREWQKNIGLIGTIEIRENAKKIDFDFATSTTPDTIELNYLFDKMLKDGVDNVVMEVSSHALELYKLEGCHFNIGIFTNLTQDHLDLHKDMESYCKAKSKLFEMTDYAIINADDKYAHEIVKNSKAKIYTYSIEKESDFKATDIEYFMDKVCFNVEIEGKKEHFILNIPGKFSVYNALGVIACCVVSNIPIDIIKNGLKNIKGVSGRIENIKNDKGFNVIVDYAHTPDGLDNILKAVKEFTKGRVISVFGCGGDRDNKKRPIMGEISGRLADYTIITSDNPRSEEPNSIIKQIEEGILKVTKNYEKLVDRKEAIKRAISIAKEGDTVLIAGKGHETYEIFADKTIYFDDREVAREILKEL